MNEFKRPLTLLALVLQFGLALPASSGLVLCVGNDGHIAVESGGCGDESPGVTGDCNEFGASTPCTDTPLAASELLSGTSPRIGLFDGPLALAPGSVSPRFVAARVSACELAAALGGPIGRQRGSILRL